MLCKWEYVAQQNWTHLSGADDQLMAVDIICLEYDLQLL